MSNVHNRIAVAAGVPVRKGINILGASCSRDGELLPALAKAVAERLRACKHPCYVEIVKQQISCSAKSWFSICYNRVGLGGG